ncbi:MAG: h16 [Belnapia sp.]|nr:h16 [Belnapia sp.]
MTRRALLAVSGILAGVLAAPALRAQARSLRLIVPFGPGGITDLVSRVVAERMALELGQPVVVENRAGAGGNIAAEAAAKAAPDGLTLLVASTGMLAVNPAIYARLPYDAARDFTPVALLASTPHVLVVNPKVATDLPGFLAAARQQEEAVSWGTAGSGSSPHQTLLLLQSLAAARLLTVHFRSGAASVQAVLAGDVAATAEATPVVAGHVRAGTLRALCVAAPKRLALLPEVATAAELGLPGFENGSVSGIVAPRGIPDAALARLASAIAAALAAPEVQARLVQQGTVPLPGDGAAFARLVAAETARWQPLLAGVRAE